ncbi:MAG: hypothetical protein CL910_19360 [Deltaproteobacteria bacterium]|nr:hypothetical protein [Deltaproteobacteria bacterium]
MALLSLVMLLWMYATRFPAMSKAGIEPQDAADTDQLKKLPAEAVRVADNYNHLFEQPTVFYAVAVSIAVLGQVDALHVQCAWAYAGLRILHSLVQATVNLVPLRFALFSLSWIALAIMIVRGALEVF